MQEVFKLQRSHCGAKRGKVVCNNNNRRQALFSVSIPSFLFIKEAVQELQLWRQEVEYYVRQGDNKVVELFPALKQIKQERRAKNLTVNTELAYQILTLPLQAVNDASLQQVGLNWNQDQYDQDYYKIYAQELPNFRDAGICGHCGKSNDQTDPDWIDFLSYVQYKAISKQLPSETLGPSPILTGFEMLHGPTVTQRLGTAPLGSNEVLRSVIGKNLLAFIANKSQSDVISVRSPVLEDIRAGVSCILSEFENLGYCQFIRLLQCGISDDEFECNYAWGVGEPAYLKYKVYNPVTLRSAQAMVEEQSFSQDFVGGTLQAYLQQCGVKAYTFKRLPSLTDPLTVIEQFTFRRVVELPSQAKII